MNRLLIALLLAALSFAASAEVHIRPINVATVVDFKLYNADGTLDVDEADSGTEVSVSCAGGAETTATNDFVDEGTFYSISLTQAEMNCARVAVIIAATTTEVFFIDTYGASAAIPSIPATLAAGSIASGAIDATAIAADAIGASELATDAIGAAEIAANAIAAAEIADSAIDNATFACSGAFPILGVTDCGTAQAATGTTLQLRSAAAFADDELIGQTVIISGGSAGVGQSRPVDDNVGSTDTLTVPTWTTTPTGTITYVQFGTAAGAAGSVSIAAGGISASSFASGAIDAAAIAADAIGASELAADAIGASEIAANALTTAEIATGAISSDEVADGAIDAGAIASDAITAAKVAADAIGASELAADAIGAAEIANNAIDAAATAADFSTEVQDADIESINGVTITGDGSGTPFNVP